MQAAIEMRDRGGAKRHECPQHDRRTRDAERPSGHRENAALGDELAHHVQIARAQRATDREFPGAPAARSEKECTDVGAGYQQQQSDRAGDRHQDRPEIASATAVGSVLRRRARELPVPLGH